MGSLLQLTRGAALGGLVAGVLWAMVLFAGLAPGANRVVLVLLALLGFIYCLIRSGREWVAALGAGGVALLGLGAALVTGPGWLEGVLITGGLSSAAWLARDRGVRWVATRADVVAAVVIILVLAALVPSVVGGETLGHDESAYALKAGAWLEGTPDTGWSIHRGPALSGFAYLVLWLGGGEAVLRSIGIISLAGLSVATWWLGARMFGKTVGALAALVVLAGPSILRRATELLTDLPAAALLVVCMALIWVDFDRREGPTYRLLWVLPLAWAAFYLRYQSILAFGLIGVAMLVIWWPSIRERWAPVVASASIGLLGLVPHAIHAFSELGSPIGILRVTGEVAGREYLGEGLVDYVLLLGWPLAGLLGLPLVGFFLWWLVRCWRRADRRHVGLFLAIPAVGQVLTLGVLSHGEPRFVFFPLALVAIGAVAGAIEITGEWRVEIQRGARLALIALMVSSIGVSMATTRAGVENRILSFEPVELAADRLVAESEGSECGVMTSYLPQITYYSGCSTEPFRTGLDPVEAIEGLDGGGRFMVLIENGKRQPTGHDLEELVEETDGDEYVVQGSRDTAVVYQFEGP